MIQINVQLHLPYEAPIPLFYYYIPSLELSSPITNLRDNIVNLFPLVCNISSNNLVNGDFNIRIKYYIEKDDFVWLDTSSFDIIKSQQTVFNPNLKSPNIDIKLTIPPNSKFCSRFSDDLFEVSYQLEDNYQEYLKSMIQHISKFDPGSQYGTSLEQINHPDRQTSGTTFIPSQTASQAAEKLKDTTQQLWKFMKSTVDKIQSTTLNTIQQLSQTNKHPTPTQEQFEVAKLNLEEIHSYVSTKPDVNNPEHLALLMALFESYFPDIPANKSSIVTEVKWKDLGWQTTNPFQEVKTSGILALYSLKYFHDKYNDRSRLMIIRNQKNISTNYPFAIVGINLCLLLIEVFRFQELDQLLNSGVTFPDFYAIFSESQSFYEIFCSCFIHIDSLWTNRKATRKEFGSIIQEVKGLVHQILLANPTSLSTWKIQAESEGMFILH